MKRFIIRFLGSFAAVFGVMMRYAYSFDTSCTKTSTLRTNSRSVCAIATCTRSWTAGSVVYVVTSGDLWAGYETECKKYCVETGKANCTAGTFTPPYASSCHCASEWGYMACEQASDMELLGCKPVGYGGTGSDSVSYACAYSGNSTLHTETTKTTGCIFQYCASGYYQTVTGLVDTLYVTDATKSSELDSYCEPCSGVVLDGSGFTTYVNSVGSSGTSELYWRAPIERAGIQSCVAYGSAEGQDTRGNYILSFAESGCAYTK